MNIPPSASISHGEYARLYSEFQRLAIGEKVSCTDGLTGIRNVAKRAGIRIAQRKNGDFLDIYRVA